MRQDNKGEDTPMSAQPHGQVVGKTPSASPITTGFARGTAVLTLDGEIPVEFLNAGDRIITRDGARTLQSVTMTSMTGEIVRVAASTLGHDRPVGCVLVGRDQAILVRDWRAKALYGTAQALIPAARMADGELIRVEVVQDMAMFILGFDDPVVIYAGGLELACAAVTVEA
jgi:Hint domain